MNIYRNHTTLEHIYEVQPDQMNPFNIMHGGCITTLMDDTAGTCCYRWCNERRVFTAGFHHIRFLIPLNIGDQLVVTATIIHSGHTSLTAIVYVVRNNPNEESVLAAWAMASFVCVQNDAETNPVPPLIINNEKARAMSALAVQIKDFSKAIDQFI